MQWYYKVLGEVVGPLSPSQMREKVLRGEIGPQTMVRKGAHGRWLAASQVNNLLPPTTDNAPAEMLDGYGVQLPPGSRLRQPPTKSGTITSPPPENAPLPDAWPPKLTAPRPVSGKAVVSLVLGFASCALLILAGLPALLLGWQALNEIANEKMRGRKMALLGMALGGLGCAATMVLAGWFWLHAPGGSLDLAEVRMRAVGTANMGYALEQQHYVQRAMLDRGGRPALSWRVRLLPYLHQRELYAQFHLDEPWQGPHNERLLTRMPEAYCSPHLQPSEGRTNLLAPVGPGTLFSVQRKLSPLEVPDDKSFTIFAVEVDDSLNAVWSAPEDLQWDPARPAAGLGGLRGGRFLALMLDGSTRLISTKADPELLKALFTAFGGERLNAQLLWPEP
jgi:hypothetical protein